MASKRYGDRFEVQDLLGKGGMGTVYRARDTELGRDVALKIVSGVTGASRMERFRREGEVTAALQHPGIVRVHSFGYEGQEAYLAYELIPEAKTLSDVLAQGDRAEVLRLLAEAGEALGHAHAEGVVHRDVKPDNVLVTEGGAARVADFGLAAVQGQERLTKTGALVGTPFYMAPEQFSRREAVGPPADVWALGVILYEALTGSLPFEAGTLLELGAVVGRAEPRPPRAVRSDISRDLEAICLKALHRDADARYPDGAAFAADLRRFLAGERVVAETTRFRAPRVHLPSVLLGGVASLAALLLVFLLAAPPADEAPAAARRSAPVREARVTCGWTRVSDEQTAKVELVFDERAQETGEGSTVEATLVALRLELSGDLPLSYDTARDEWLPLNEVLGETWSYDVTRSGRSGQSPQLRMLRLRVRDSMAEAAPAVRDLAAQALDPEQLQRHLDAVRALSDPETLSGSRRVPLWPTPALGLECAISATRVEGRVQGRLASWELLAGPKDRKVREPTAEVEALIEGGEVRRASVDLAWRESGVAGAERKELELRYESTPRPGAAPGGEPHSR